MAKNKRRKKMSPSGFKRQVSLKHSKSYFTECYTKIRLIIQLIGGDPALFDEFTKRQKEDIFLAIILSPRITALPGHKVPRQYTKYVQEELTFYLRKSYFNKEAGVSWMDMLNYAHIVILNFRTESFLCKLPEKQKEVAARLLRLFEEKDIEFQIQNTIASQIRVTLMMLSQPNFRIYGQDVTTNIKVVSDKTGLVQIIYLTAHESQSIYFKHQNRERIAFRLAVGRFIATEYRGATIALSKIYPNVEEDRTLNIYVQSHALHRFKERVDTVYPMMRNELFVLSLMFTQRIVDGPSGMRLISCIMPHEDEEKNVGYFTFTIDGDNLFVLTLLPLLAKDTPEGRILFERLQLSVDDLKYLGMDKLSFFYEVDIQQIPPLKKVLFDELHMESVRSIYNSFRPKKTPFDEKKTLFVKEFFRKAGEQHAEHAEILDELSEMEK
jgi:hypothetical protein